MTVHQADQLGIENFALLSAHVLVPPAMTALLTNPDDQVQGFLAAGHVCTVMGENAYEAIAIDHQVPIVVTGFEPVDILQGILSCVQQLETRQFACDNQYRRAVQAEGNAVAQRMLDQVFEPVELSWRGLGTIPQSGLGLKSAFSAWDAQQQFRERLATLAPQPESPICISGKILQGHCKPSDCSAFGKDCTPEMPLGAPMVSSEGACAAYYRYRQQLIA